MEDIAVSFPGGKRVDARVGPFVVHTDQPTDLGGEGSAVAPFDLFLASLATCAGLYVLGFCQARGLSTDGLALHQRVEVDPATKLPARIRLEVTLPPTFPEKYRVAILRAAEGCKVKKTIAASPSIEVVAVPEHSAPAERPVAAYAQER
jgi:ribosomal protein S12 methylthiotransferase accessory factor